MVRLKPHWIAILFGIIFVFSANPARACPFELPTVRATVKGHELTIELATTPEARSCGLSHRASLPENRGMLFVYPNPQKLSFWMMDTLVPLSIAFIDDTGGITGIQKMDPIPPTRSYTSPGPARYALEVNQGWFEKNGIGVGDVVEFVLPVTLDIR